MAINRVGAKGIASCTVAAQDIEDASLTNANFGPSTISNSQLANSSVTINGTSVSLGGSINLPEPPDWQAVTVADGSTQLTATAGKGYFLDTNTGVIEVFLPTSPSRGDFVVLVDYSGTFGTNQAIVNTGGKNIDSTTGPEFKLTTNNTIAYFVYVDAAKGWLVYLNQAAGTTPSGVMNDQGGYDTVSFIQATGGTVTTSGNFKIHTFTGDGCFVVSNAGSGTSAQPSVVDYLVVAGGAAGGIGMQGGAPHGGGGGAGGFRLSNSEGLPSPTTSPLATPTGITVSETSYPITVGAGGAAPGGPPYASKDGSPSIFSTITSAGGGAGGTGFPAPCNSSHGRNGGSGGGGGGGSYARNAGTGNTPPVSPSQGSNGGTGENVPNGDGAGGGGGGAGGTGANAPSTNGGAGGVGSYVSNTFLGPTSSCYGTPGPVGSTRYFSGGGGGAGDAPGGSGGAGGSGGGGSGNDGSPGAGGGPNPGTANTGGAGGGGGAGTPACSCNSHFVGGNGGKGIVIIRYKFQ